MKNPNFLYGILLFLSVILLASCSAIAGIFKAGMGFGIFLVVLVIVIVVVIILRAGKK